MDKLVPDDVLKAFQSIVLPLELKINSLLDVIRGLEAKIDELTVTKSNEANLKTKSVDKRPLVGARQTVSSYATVTGSRTPTTTRRVATKSIAIETRPNTRRQRAVAAAVTTTQDQAQHHGTSPLPHPMVDTSNIAHTPSVASGASNAHPLNNITQDSQRWSVVRGRQRKMPIRGAGDVDSELATVEKTMQIHVWSLRSDVTEDQVKSYMTKKCATGAPYKVEKLQLRHTNYASFVITVPESLFEFYMSANSWPHNTEISEWFRRQGRRKENRDTSRSNDNASSNS